MFNLFRRRAETRIEFICPKKDFGIIPKPYPAGKNTPDWFKALPPKVAKGFKSSTIKRCAPFTDALTAGYIIPLAADVYIKSTEQGAVVNWYSQYGEKDMRPMVEAHSPVQVTSDKTPNPEAPKMPLKFINYWLFKTPPGYSLMFGPPAGKRDKRFTCLPGIVDHPYYELEFVNFPFFLTDPHFEGIIEAGTPLVQVIPIRKDNLLTNYRHRPMSEEDESRQTRLRRARGAHESLYRDQMWRR